MKVQYYVVIYLKKDNSIHCLPRDTKEEAEKTLKDVLAKKGDIISNSRIVKASLPKMHLFRS